MFGYAESEIRNQSLTTLMPAAYRDRHLKGLKRMQTRGEKRIIGQIVEFEGRRKDGSKFPLELSLSEWQVADGWFYTAIIRDITARKQNEDQLRQLSRAVEQSPASIVITDVNGIIEYVNPKFTALTGYAFEEALGQTPRILKSGKTPLETYQDLWRTILAGREWRGELLNCKKNGEFYWENVSISAIIDSKNIITHFVAVKEDVTIRKESEEKIRLLNAELGQLAITDYLTNLYNRRYFMQRGDKEFKRSKRHKHPLALLMLDIDEFKKVNDIYGHEVGDLALRQVATVLKSSLRETDILGRIGGEEFAALLPNTALRDAFVLAERIRRTMESASFQTLDANTLLTITISIGAAVFTNEMSDIDDLLRNADAALYQAKSNGRNCVMKYEAI
jgi:diguanylate cyclase (GGDEF)-like protein/PAS domain S-box-containing protein